MLFIKTLLLSPILLFVHSYQGIRAMLSLTAKAIKAKGTDENTTIGVMNLGLLIMNNTLLLLLKRLFQIPNQKFLAVAIFSFIFYLAYYTYEQRKCSKGESIMENQGDAMIIGTLAFTTLLLSLFSVI